MARYTLLMERLFCGGGLVLSLKLVAGGTGLGLGRICMMTCPALDLLFVPMRFVRETHRWHLCILQFDYYIFGRVLADANAERRQKQQDRCADDEEVFFPFGFRGSLPIFLLLCTMN